jgi:hypothetical protein
VRDIAREALLYARETCAQRAEANSCPPAATEWRLGLHDGLPDIRSRVDAFLAGRAFALEEAAMMVDHWNPGRRDRLTEEGIADAIRALSEGGKHG